MLVGRHDDIANYLRGKGAILLIDHDSAGIQMCRVSFTDVILVPRICILIKIDRLQVQATWAKLKG